MKDGLTRSDKRQFRINANDLLPKQIWRPVILGGQGGSDPPRSTDTKRPIGIAGVRGARADGSPVTGAPPQ